MNIISPRVGRDGCSFYRVEQICKELGNIDGNEYRLFSYDKTEDEVIEMANGADVIIFRACHYRMFKQFQQFVDCSKKLIVLDMDDDIWNVNPLSDMYRVYGDKELYLEDKPLWTDGVANFNIARNRANLQEIRDFCEEADAVTVTTEHMKECIERETGQKNVYVVPNALNLNNWNKWNFKSHKGVRIGWTGGSSHYPDWRDITDELPKIDKALWVILGCKWDYTLKEVDYEFHNWVDVECFPYKMASLDVDMAVIPLADIPFNKYKSNIKWLEYSALGVPCVIPDLSPYKEEAVHMETALIYKNKEEFVTYTNQLIQDKDLRNRIGNSARKYVEEKRKVEYVAKEYNRFLSKQLKEKNGI